jgi:hypothetical protein
LKLFRDIQLVRHKEIIEQERGFFMTIQEYQIFKNFKLKQFIVERIGEFLGAKAVTIQEIRTILYHFRFAYRFFYRDLLEYIIKEAKDKLIILLVAMPELLPIEFDGKEQDALDEGVWRGIFPREWDESLYYEKVACLENKSLVDEMIKGVWFRRNWTVTHDMIAESTASIKEQDLKNNSVEMFYFFIEKVFENITDEGVLKRLLSYVERTYSKFPSHLTNKVLLYSKLYHYHEQNHELVKDPHLDFSTFLTLCDPHLFKFFFACERVKKGCLLREIRELYLAYAINGEDGFN